MEKDLVSARQYLVVSDVWDFGIDNENLSAEILPANDIEMDEAPDLRLEMQYVDGLYSLVMVGDTEECKISVKDVTMGSTETTSESEALEILACAVENLCEILNQSTALCFWPDRVQSAIGQLRSEEARADAALG